MAIFLYKLGSLAYRKKWPFLAFWLILMIAIGTLAGAFAKSPSTSFTIPGLDSVVTMEKMQERFPGAEDATTTASGTIVVQAPEGGTLTDPAVLAEVNEMLGEVRATGVLADPETIVDPVMASQGLQAQMVPQL